MGFSLYVSAAVKIPAKNKENALHTVRAKRGIVHIIDPLLELVAIMMEHFQSMGIDEVAMLAIFSYLIISGGIAIGLVIMRLFKLTERILD